MGKRAATQAGAPAWKKFRGNGVKSKVNTIVSALRDSGLDSEVPETARWMLADGASAAFATVANRHKFQIEMCNLILETLQDIASRLQNKVDEAKKDASALATEQESKKAELTAAGEILTEAKDAVAKKAEEHEEAKKVLSDLEQAWASLESEGVSVKRRRDQQVKEQTKFTDFLENMLKVLLEKGPEAGGSEKAAKKMCEKLMKQVTHLGAEPALQASAPSVLLKKAEERQGFDTHVVESVQGLLTGRLEQIQKALDEIADEEKAREPQVTAKAEEVTQAKARLEDMKQQLEAAEEMACEKEVNVAKMQSSLEAFETSAQEKAKAIEAAEANVTVFAEVLAIYHDLHGDAAEDAENAENATVKAEALTAPAVLV